VSGERTQNSEQQAAAGSLIFLTIPFIDGYYLSWMEKFEPQRYSKVARYDGEDNNQ
jgi:hypothetical protein